MRAPNVGVCSFCGWEGDFPFDFVGRDSAGREIGSVGDGLELMSSCPRCDRDAVRVYRRRERIEGDIATLVREADLSVGQLVRLRDALARAGPETTSLDIARQVPKARRVVDQAQRMSPANWIALLAVIVTALVGAAGILVAHEDAVQARAPQPPSRTSQLSDQDLRHLRELVRAHQHPPGR